MYCIDPKEMESAYSRTYSPSTHSIQLRTHLLEGGRHAPRISLYQLAESTRKETNDRTKLNGLKVKI